MALKPVTKATLQIHFCVLLWGFTAILGKLISLAALPLVWWRMLIVVATLLLVPRVLRSLRNLPARLWLAFGGVGGLVALHWLTFYGAIKLSNASVAATCIALASPFTAIVEPWVTRTKFSPRDLALGVAVLPGVALVVGGVPSGMHRGIAVGAVSALLVAVFGAMNKRLAHRGDALMATALELGSGVLVLSMLAPVLPALLPELAGPVLAWPSPRDGILLATLAFACTLLPFSLSFVALRHISAFSAQLAVNLEPVYAIVLAIVLLGEQRELTPQFYVGVAIIVGAVSVRPLLGRTREVSEIAGA
ncbi:MAG TPA: DMT family transporter [Gammaproteobacteria bacterium]|nr:DMT family transporter [Gammaproteobacteria bacterium]